eukprot:s10183_g3.t1
MESELYQATEAAVLIESMAALLDEIAGLYVPRKLCVDNTAAVAMATEVQEAGARDTYVSGLRISHQRRKLLFWRSWRLRKAFEGLPKALADDPTASTASVSVADFDELLVFTALAVVGAIVCWELVKHAGRWLWKCLCKTTKARRARKLRDMAKAAAEAEVDRALTPQRSLPEEPLGASSSTSWFPSSLAPEKRSTAT